MITCCFQPLENNRRNFTPKHPGRKRQRVEDLASSKTVEKLTDLVGRGKMSVSGATELAQSIVSDHELPHQAIRAFSSLGTNGAHPQNAERDLHRWLDRIYGCQLQPYTIKLGLQLDTTKVREVPIRVLAPHEVLNALANMQSTFAFNSLLLGCLNDRERINFWEHVSGLAPWSNHEVLKDESVRYDRLIGLTLHGDGAVMKRDDECFVWSFSSIFSSESLVKDPLLQKFPIAIIPERHMLSKEVAHL